jgi:hypothetical protein
VIRTENIISAAREATRIDDPIDDTTLENLSRYVTAVNREARLSDAGKVGVQGWLVGALVNRLRVERYAQEHPDLLERPIERPMFVFGFPRSGTTLAVNLLNQDPARRGFLRWQAEDPIPPVKAGEMRTDPRCLAKQIQLEEEAKLMPHIAAMHFEDADSVTECQLSMIHTFCTHMFEAVTEVPSWRAWFLGTSYLPTFRYQKRLLQIMQSETPGRWLLKNPWHALFLKDLTAVYPDAQYVMTHRDPMDVVPSYCDLIKAYRGLYSDEIDLKNIAESTLDIFGRIALGAIDHKRVHGAGSIYDLHYQALMRDPIDEMKKLYRHFDEPWTETIEETMKKFLAKNPQGKHGQHDYSLEEFGLSPEVIRTRFAEYCREFNVGQSS